MSGVEHAPETRPRLPIRVLCGGGAARFMKEHLRRVTRVHCHGGTAPRHWHKRENGLRAVEMRNLQSSSLTFRFIKTAHDHYQC